MYPQPGPVKRKAPVFGTVTELSVYCTLLPVSGDDYNTDRYYNEMAAPTDYLHFRQTTILSEAIQAVRLDRDTAICDLRRDFRLAVVAGGVVERDGTIESAYGD